MTRKGLSFIMNTRWLQACQDGLDDAGMKKEDMVNESKDRFCDKFEQQQLHYRT